MSAAYLLGLNVLTHEGIRIAWLSGVVVCEKSTSCNSRSMEMKRDNRFFKSKGRGTMSSRIQEGAKSRRHHERKGG